MKRQVTLGELVTVTLERRRAITGLTFTSQDRARIIRNIAADISRRGRKRTPKLISIICKHLKATEIRLMKKVVILLLFALLSASVAVAEKPLDLDVLVKSIMAQSRTLQMPASGSHADAVARALRGLPPARMQVDVRQHEEHPRYVPQYLPDGRGNYQPVIIPLYSGQYPATVIPMGNVPPIVIPPMNLSCFQPGAHCR